MSSFRHAYCATAIIMSTMMASCVSEEQVKAASIVGSSLATVGASVFSKVSYPTIALLPGDQKKIHIHGRWCGKGFPSDADFFTRIRFPNNDMGTLQAFIKPDLFPVDEVDAACAHHDFCYHTATRDRDMRRINDCDFVLMCDLWQLDRTMRPELILPRARVMAWAGGSALSRLSSDCVAHGYRGLKRLNFIRDV